MNGYRRIPALALAALLLLTAACTRPAASEPQAGAPAGGGAAATAEPVTIRMLTQAWSTRGTLWQDAWVAAFQDQYPQYRVELVWLGNDLEKWNEIARLKIEERAIDLIPTNFLDVDALVREGLLLPLDPYIQESRVDLAPYGGLVDGMRWDGRLYDLPWGIETLALVYNQDLFTAAGVPLPQPGWTWDDFRAAAAALTTDPGPDKTWGGAFVAGFDLVFRRVEQKTGRPVYEANPELFRDALQFFHTMAFADQSLLIGSGTAREVFTAGQAGMMSASPWYLTRWAGQLPFAWDVAPWPTLPGAPGAAGPVGLSQGALTMGIAATSPHPEAAWAFLRFVTGEEGAVIAARHSILPAYNSPAVRAAYLDRTPAPPPGAEQLFRTTWYLYPRDRQSAAYRIALAQAEAAQAVLLNEQPLDEAYAGLLEKLQAIK